MSTVNINVKKVKYCGICKYWYDPTNMYISPVNPALNMWKMERDAKCKCLKKTGAETRATFMCSKFESKL